MYQLDQVFSDSLQEMTETLKSLYENDIRYILVVLTDPEKIQYTINYFNRLLAVQTEYYRRKLYGSRLVFIPPENIRI